MATEKATMCSVLLVLLIFASNWEATVQDSIWECWHPSETKVFCIGKWRRKQCNDECMDEGYDYGKCGIVFGRPGCLCHKPFCNNYT
ncbi:hypothetical protein ACP70R_018542 [Stipagrostis hirtigluma subsp. patula]